MKGNFETIKSGASLGVIRVNPKRLYIVKGNLSLTPHIFFENLHKDSVPTAPSFLLILLDNDQLPDNTP